MVGRVADCTRRPTKHQLLPSYCDVLKLQHSEDNVFVGSLDKSECSCGANVHAANRIRHAVLRLVVRKSFHQLTQELLQSIWTNLRRPRRQISNIHLNLFLHQQGSAISSHGIHSSGRLLRCALLLLQHEKLNLLRIQLVSSCANRGRCGVCHVEVQLQRLKTLGSQQRRCSSKQRPRRGRVRKFRYTRGLFRTLAARARI
mmetsp:Transcript_50541/g.110583  ORF Transcript_50541/g.110583 Transcript_50541/m.110583 type:complete len:201 (-) Transcript_50541:216-818(-)